jgi:cell division septum initiation protein DivIVA
MIHSSSVEGHHFLRSRRRGYEPAEVDAVMKRLVATLRRYEAREAELAEPDDQLPVTVLDEVRAGRLASHEEAVADRERIRQEAFGILEEAKRTAAASLAAADEEAARIMGTARDDAAKLLARRNARADELITAALSEVKALRARVIHETNEYRAGKKTEAAAMLRTAELQASQLIEDARHEAGSILGRARREHMLLEQRIGQLRSAIAGIEGQFRHLAESTLEQTEIMSTMISLEAEGLEEVLSDLPAEPDVVRLTQQDLTVDLTAEAGEDEKPGEAAPARSGDDHFVVSPGDTIYQRRGGGLRRRLEDEDVQERPS